MRSLKRMLSSFFNKILFSSNLFKGSVDLGLFFLRIFPSFFLFYNHGLGKLNKGAESWAWLGEAAMPIVGINFGFVIFGFLAALSESIFALFVKSMLACTSIFDKNSNQLAKIISTPQTVDVSLRSAVAAT